MSEHKVAACCRVSTNRKEQKSSLKTQIKKRLEFMKMLKACKQGRIDMLLTKSISRFGRNTLDTLKTLYELFNLGVKVYFEKENINNYNKEMRTMMGIYAGFAQEESKNMSDNIKWGYS